jgi:arabinose-5-phosphate isomerase
MTRDLDIAKRVLTLEAAALNQLAGSLGAEFERATDALISVKGRVICAGIGKSGHVARKIAATFASTGTAALFVHPAEASHGDLGMIAAGDAVLALSKSGDTSELSDLVHYTRRFGVKLVAMTAERNSALAKAADVALILPDAPEACAETRAPTTSTTLMMALGDALAVALLERRGFQASDFRTFHPRGKLGAMLLKASDVMRAGKDLPLIKSGAPLADGVAEISRGGAGCVGVLSGGLLIGVITDGDIRRMVAKGKIASAVDEAMTRVPVTAAPDALAASVLHTMNEKKITQVFVVEGARPAGLIHLHDLIRAGVA